MLSLIHTRTFLAVIDARGFRAAGRSLGLAASTVVEHIDQLEAELTLQLLVRNRGKVRCTPYGEMFLPLARALIDTATRARDLLAKAPLRVAAASNVGVYMLPPKIMSFAAATGITVEPWIGPNPDVVDRLQSGRADVAVTEWWDGRAGFDAIAWRREPLVVIVPPGHAWAHRRSVEPAELLEQTILGGEAGSGTATVLRAALGSIAGCLRTRSGYGSTEAVKRAVRANQGISIVPAASIVDDVASRHLVAVEVRNAGLEKQISVVVPRGLKAESAGMQFARHVLKE
jgi:DNA-binding transcriptional LysR family regulator